MSTTTYTIGPTLKQAKISGSTLRAWEKLKLIPTPDRSSDGRRQYTEAQVAFICFRSAPPRTGSQEVTPAGSMNRLFRVEQVEDVTGFGRSWIYEKVRRGEFPRPIKLGRSSAWLESEVEGYIDAQIRSEPAATQGPNRERRVLRRMWR